MRRFPHLTITLLVALGIATMVFQLGLLMYAGYAMIALAFVSHWLAKTWSESVEVRRDCQQLTAEVGTTIAVLVAVKNVGRWPIGWLLFEDLLPHSALWQRPPRLEVTGQRLQLVMLKSGATKTMLYQLKCNRRGYYQLGPTVVETGDLFGLHRRYRVGVEPNFLLVYPEIVPIAGYDVASRRPIGEVRMTHRLYEDPTRMAGVRAYQNGDALNRVHWRATARTGTLHSKVYEPSSVAGATILIDFHQQSHPAAHEPVRSELAITAAASLAHVLYHMGQQCGLVTNGRDAADRIRQEGYSHDWRTRQSLRQSSGMWAASDRLRPVVVPTRRGPEAFRQIQETLARLELTDGLTLAQLIAETDSRIPRDATVVVIVSTVTSDVAIALGTLRRRGLAVTALVNCFDEYEYAQAAGALLAEGVEPRQLRDRESIALICRRYVVG